MNTLVVMQKMLEKQYGQSGLSVFYRLLWYQASNGARLTENRFGFTGEKAIYHTFGQLDMIGGGSFNLVHADTKKKHFIIKSKSTFAIEYKQTFGMQKNPVCWCLKGALVGVLNTHLHCKSLECIETECIAQGKPTCVFMVRPRSDFDLSDKKIKQQLPVKTPLDFAEIFKQNLRGMPKRQ